MEKQTLSGTSTALILYASGEGYIVVSNPAWTSLKHQQRHKVDLELLRIFEGGSETFKDADALSLVMSKGRTGLFIQVSKELIRSAVLNYGGIKVKRGDTVLAETAIYPTAYAATEECADGAVDQFSK